MDKYLKTFVLAFIVCELIELFFCYFYKENIQQFVVGIITSVFIALCISFSLNYIKWEKIIKNKRKS